MIHFPGGATDDISQDNTGFGNSVGNGSAALWIRLGANQAAETAIFMWGSAGIHSDQIRISTTSNGLNFGVGSSAAPPADSEEPLVVGEWHWLAIRNGIGDLFAYMDGLKELTLTNLGGGAGRDDWQFGIGPAAGLSPLIGDIAAIKIWDADIGELAILNEQFTYLALHRANLVCESPAIWSATQNLVGPDFTAAGSTAYADGGPPLIWTQQPTKTWEPPASPLPFGAVHSLVGAGGLVADGGLAGPGGGLAG